MEFQIQKLIKSLSKFSNPIERIDIVTQDAEIQEKNIIDLKQLGELIIERAKEAMIIPFRRDQIPLCMDHSGKGMNFSMNLLIWRGYELFNEFITIKSLAYGINTKKTFALRMASFRLS